MQTPDLVATFSSDTYTVDGPRTPMKHHAVRVVYYEDRFIEFEQRLFCDKPSKKNITLRVSSIRDRVEQHECH